MHNYIHEYKPNKGKFNYLGSVCRTEGCPDSRKRTTLELVKRHNDDTGQMFSRSNSVTVQK